MPRRSDIEFDENTAKSSKPRATRYSLRDKLHKGLILRVQPTGTKTWLVELERGCIRKVGDAGTLTLGQARTKATQMQGKHFSGEKIKSSRSITPTLEKYIDGKYREHAKASYKTPQRGDQVADRILKALEADATTQKKKLDKIAKLDIERWKRKRGKLVKKTTLKRDLGALSTAFNLALTTHKFIEENPAAGVVVKVDDDKRVRFLSDDERKRLRAALDARDRDFYAARKHNAANRKRRGLEPLPLDEFKDYLTPLTILVMNTGLRRSEALSLTWDNVQLTGSPRLTVKAAMTKNSKTRHVPLNDVAVDILKRWRKQSGSDGHVFVHRVTGTKLNKAHRAWKKLMDDAVIEDFRFHDLRHDFASQLVMRGTPLYLVKQLLGHGSIEMTQRYAHLADDALAKAVEVLN